MPNKNKNFDVDNLLNSLFPTEKMIDLFEKRIAELDISPTHALEILDIEYRALQGILNGTSTRVDTVNFIRLASFLRLTKEKVIDLYFKALEENYPDTIAFPKEKIDFINSHFDLATLYKAKFITTISDYRYIEHRLNSHFGLKSIFEYKLPTKNIAFSAGIKQPKDLFTRAFWINSAIDAFEEFNNPYDYDKTLLMKYFPEIRWHSTNVEQGLLSVISDLYKLGVTVFYQSSMSNVNLKGATLNINNKPCIIITDYKGFYTTLWHTLCHELCHVLFDFEDITKSVYHISEEESEDFGILEKEKDANRFAREYLFSKDKLFQAKPHINNKKFIIDFAAQHQVHPSFIYTYYAFDFDQIDDKAWAKAKVNNPSFELFIKKIENPWVDSKPTKQHVAYLKKENIYN